MQGVIAATTTKTKTSTFESNAERCFFHPQLSVIPFVQSACVRIDTQHKYEALKNKLNETIVYRLFRARTHTRSLSIKSSLASQSSSLSYEPKEMHV